MADFVFDVFVPNGTPTHTYVTRAEEKNEEKLAAALDMPKMVISISGPSKTGKTALGSGLIDHIQKMTIAAIAMADMKVWAQRS